MTQDYDLCVIGSGAGGGPVALTLAEAGRSVLVLEKGPWLKEGDFFKDELACCRRSAYTPSLRDEQHVLEQENDAGGWDAQPTSESGWDFWNGNCVGGSSNFMSGFFYRLKPADFRLRSEFGPIEGANIADWPITYADLEPYYAKVERRVGVSGRILPHPFLEPRSTPDLPYPATREHPICARIDHACRELGLHPLPTPRAILPAPAIGRRGCEYSGYCGSYGCASGAKGSARAALLSQAVATGRCEIRPHAKVYRLQSDAKGRIVAAHYYDAQGRPRTATAKVFAVACQAIESARLLLASPGPKHPDGPGNGYGRVGKNLLFSAGGSGRGEFPYASLPPAAAEALKRQGPFVNRGLQDWYYVDDPALGGRAKGGTIDFLLRHPNPIAKAQTLVWDDEGWLVWGRPLQRQLKALFTEALELRFEVFNDWLPTDQCFVALDPKVKDKWGSPVARVRLGYHPHDLKVGRFLAAKGVEVLEAMGAENIRWGVSGSPPQNLVAGGCRFGSDPKTSVLDPDCRVHGAENLYVTDGSFMPTGGSVPYTWTIYANAFRVADAIRSQLGNGEVPTRAEG
jgi:choline dehydrogenase-like flavoprotein